MNELIPKIKPKAPDVLKENVLDKIKKSQIIKIKLVMRRITAVAAMVAVLILMPLTLTGKETKAINLLEASIAKIDDVKSMIIKFLVRTLPADNFDYIDCKENFVAHTITEVFENQTIFRIEKPQRVAVFDGKSSYLWIKTTDEVLVIEGFAGIYGEYNQLLLNPQDLLKNAERLAKSKGAKTTLKEDVTSITLTIEAKAQGNFSQNSYSKNSSIEESDNKQVYVFDKTSKLLQSVEVSIFTGGKYVTVLKTEKIDYNIPIDTKVLMELPENLTFKPYISDFQNQVMANITSKQAVETALNALANKDISKVETFFSQYPVIFIKETLFGLKIISIGEPFKSGQYIGEFIPIKVRLSNGYIKSTNVAVRNDNPNKVWILDGGI